MKKKLYHTHSQSQVCVMARCSGVPPELFNGHLNRLEIPEAGSTNQFRPGFRGKMDLNELDAYLTGFWLTDLANFSAFVYKNVPDLNWAGFYLSDSQKLRLGPFIGKPACTEIAFGKGVCGTAFTNDSPLIVGDVDAFPGHIRCDSDSKSELVLPFRISGRLVGVFDLDSPQLNRFSPKDQRIVTEALELLSKKIVFSSDFLKFETTA